MTHHPWHRKRFASEAIADCEANILAHLLPSSIGMIDLNN